MTLLSKNYTRLGENPSPPELFILSFDEHVEIEIQSIEGELFNIAEAKKREKYLKKRLKALTTCANKLEAKESKSIVEEVYIPGEVNLSKLKEIVEEDLVLLEAVDSQSNVKVKLDDFM